MPGPAPLSDRQAAFVAASLASRQIYEIIDCFDTRGIAVAPLKGVWFNPWLYDDPGERPMTDVDILVSPEQEPEAGEALTGLGYRPDESPKARLGFGAIIERTFRRPGALPVELHRGVATGRGAARLSARMLAEGRPGPVPFNRPCVRLADPELALAGLALHFRDHGLTLSDYQAEDVRRLAHRPDLRPARLVALAEEAGCRLALDRLLRVCGVDPLPLARSLPPVLRLRGGLLSLCARRDAAGFHLRLGLGGLRPVERAWRLALHVCLSRDSLIESAASQADHVRFLFTRLRGGART